MRLFIALTLDDALRTRLALRALELVTLLNAPMVAWSATGADSMHVTLKFLGETDASPESIEHVLRPIAEPTQAFPLSVRGVGAFPSALHAHVLWAGITEGHDPLVQLASAVDRACFTLGFSPEKRPFTGHITLARTRKQLKYASAIKALKEAENEAFGEMMVRDVTLYRSDLSRSGARHTVLWKLPLAKNA
jgi:2'-5' RNA ligase